jgi:hypothetical protein
MTNDGNVEKVKEAKAGNYGQFWTQKWLVIGTWIMAIASLLSIMAAIYFSSRQIDEMKKATQLEFRPYLVFMGGDCSYNFQWRLKDAKSAAIERVPIESLQVNSREYMAVTDVECSFNINHGMANTGRTPFHLIGKKISALTEDEWVNKLKKSENELVKKYCQNRSRHLSVDLVWVPGDERGSGNSSDTIFINKDKFKNALDSGNEIIIYPYFYAEYADIFDNRYNFLYVGCDIFKIESNFEGIKLTRGPTLMEKYRWDVAL